MNAVPQLFVATAFIAVFAGLRMYFGHWVMRHRPDCPGTDGKKECAGGCGGIRAAVEQGANPGVPNLKRRA
jgi:hypothetical protein